MTTEMMLKAVQEMKHSPIRNYAIPGLTSWLIGTPDPAHGCVRLFDSERQHVEPISPHSHRFDFTALVLEGQVTNRVWTTNEDGDLWEALEIIYEGEPGKYRQQRGLDGRWFFKDALYKPGSCYHMKAGEVHSIYFGRGAKVLMFEGPNVSDRSIVLQPMANNTLVPTFEVRPWMFKRDEAFTV